MNTIPPDANPPVRLLMRAGDVLGTAQPDWLVQAPGREMWIAGCATQTNEYEITSDDHNRKTRFSHRSAKTRQTVLRRPLPRWARYPAGVVTLLGDSGVDVPGFRALLLGNEPEGPRYDFAAGLVVAAFCYILADQPHTPDALTQIVDRVRREYVP